MGLQITVEAATRDNTSAFAALSAEQLGPEVSVSDVDHATWKHLDNPSGQSTAVSLGSGDNPVGRLWLQPKTWLVNGQRVRAVNPVDLLIAEGHRDIMSFLRMWRRAAREAAALGEFWYHTSNPVSDELYSKMLHYKPVFELDGHVIPLRTRRLASLAGVALPGPLAAVADAVLGAILRLMAVLTGRLAGLQVEEGLPSQEELQQLCAAHHAVEPVSAERSTTALAWRWADSGSVRYTRYSARDRRGRVVCVVLVRLMDANGVHGGFVVDVVGAPAGRAGVAALWSEVARHSAARGSDALFLFCNRNNAALKHLARMPWVLVPRRRLPQRIPVFVHGSDQQREQLTRAYITLADFDMF